MPDESKGVVRVGVRRWNVDQRAKHDEPANSMIGPVWVEIDGIRIPGDVLLFASHQFENAGEEADNGIGIARFAVICSSYETVDADTEERIDAGV